MIDSVGVTLVMLCTTVGEANLPKIERVCGWNKPLSVPLVVNSYQQMNPDYLSAIEAQSAQFASIRQWAARAATSRGIGSIYESPEGRRLTISVKPIAM